MRGSLKYTVVHIIQGLMIEVDCQGTVFCGELGKQRDIIFLMFEARAFIGFRKDAELNHSMCTYTSVFQILPFEDRVWADLGFGERILKPDFAWILDWLHFNWKQFGSKLLIKKGLWSMTDSCLTPLPSSQWLTLGSRLAKSNILNYIQIINK